MIYKRLNDILEIYSQTQKKNIKMSNLCVWFHRMGPAKHLCVLIVRVFTKMAETFSNEYLTPVYSRERGNSLSW